MSKTPFGLSTLMEAMRYSEAQEKETNALFEAVTGESIVGDTIKDQLIESDPIDEMGDEFVDEDDPELNRILELIPEDDEEEMLDELDGILESAI